MAAGSSVTSSSPTERYFASRALSALAVSALVILFLVLPPAGWVIRWAMGLPNDLSFRRSVEIAIVLGVLVMPLAVVGWRFLGRPELVLEPKGQRTFVGRRPVKALPRREIRSIEVRESRWTRIVVAHMTPGLEIVIDPPSDLRVPLLRDHAFDQRVARLQDWLKGPGNPS